MSTRKLQRNFNRVRRLRLAVGIAVFLGISLSVAINILHAPDNHWARLIAGAPPLAVWVILEFSSHIPSSSRLLSVVRVIGSAIVASGAVYLSYAQQYAAIIALGFPADQARIWPAIIDGTMMVMSVSLVEVSRKIRQIEGDLDDATDNDPQVRQAELAKYEDPKALAFREALKRSRSGIDLPASVSSLNGSDKPKTTVAV